LVSKEHSTFAPDISLPNFIFAAKAAGSSLSTGERLAKPATEEDRGEAGSTMVTDISAIPEMR